MNLRQGVGEIRWKMGDRGRISRVGFTQMSRGSIVMGRVELIDTHQYHGP